MKGSQINIVWGVWSIVIMFVVTSVIMFVPHGMGPVHPPSAFTLLIFPLVLVAVFIILSRAASKTK
ncbi:hypothetical protein TIFTF001_006224 [Ficus carica]|uniref:Uncharacterized protein n=1 Tax=Ficus carica TaxID=3494 RepID=A0AA88DFG7_FICCA|nr:hypothetical protein TIFTF001_006224 [Ficus carica]